jgi:hypothetical protein
VNSALVLVVSDSGPVSIVVSGRSTTRQVWVAGDSSRLPDGSIATTPKV